MGDYPTKEQLLKAVEEENWQWLGWQIWIAYASLPNTDLIYKYHDEVWCGLTKKQQRLCEKC